MQLRDYNHLPLYVSASVRERRFYPVNIYNDREPSLYIYMLWFRAVRSHEISLGELLKQANAYFHAYILD